MIQRKKQGFTILEAVIAILIITGISVAAISSVLAARGLNERYYSRILAYNTVENICESIETADAASSGKTDAFLEPLTFLYELEKFNASTKLTSGYYQEDTEDGIITYRIYFDETYAPVKCKIDEAGEPVEPSAEPACYAEITVDTSLSQTVLQCSRVSTTQTESVRQDGRGIDQTAAVTTTDYVVAVDTVGQENTYRILSASETVETTTALYADMERQVVTERQKSRVESKLSFSDLTQEAIQTELGSCLGLDGSVDGEVMSKLNMAAYHVSVRNLKGKELAASAEDIRCSLGQAELPQDTEKRTYAEVYAEKQQRSSRGLSLGFAGGDGSEEYPFLIGNAAQLAAMNDLSDAMAPRESITGEEFLVLDGEREAVYYYGSTYDFEKDAEGSVLLYLSEADEPDSGDDEDKVPVATISIEQDSDSSWMQVDLSCSLDELEETVTVMYLPGTLLGLSETVGGESEQEITDLDSRLMTADGLYDMEVKMRRGEYYHFRLTNNIDLSDQVWEDETVCESFCGCFDGDGYCLTAADNQKLTLFGSVSGDSVLRNFDITERGSGVLSVAGTAGMECGDDSSFSRTAVILGGEGLMLNENESVSLSTETPDDTTTLENISIYGSGYLRDGTGPYLQSAMGCRVTFTDCDNYALLTCAEGSSAIYVAAQWGAGTDLSFEKCGNYGTLFARSAALFVSCEGRTTTGTDKVVGTVSVLGSNNFGCVWGRKDGGGAGYVCGDSEEFPFAELTGAYTKATVQVEEQQKSDNNENNGEDESVTVVQVWKSAEEVEAAERISVSASSPKAMLPSATVKWDGTLTLIEAEPEGDASPKSLLVQLWGSYHDGKRHPLSVSLTVPAAYDEEEKTVSTTLEKILFAEEASAEEAGIEEALLESALSSAEDADEQSGVPYARIDYNGVSYVVFDLTSGSSVTQPVCSVLLLDENGKPIGFAE